MNKSKFQYGQIVYLRMDNEQYEYLVTAVIYRDNITYELSNANNINVYQEIEISSTKDQTKCLGLKN